MQLSFCGPIIFVLFLLLSSSVYADYAINASEIVMLPSFCRHLTSGNFAPDAKSYHITGPASVDWPHLQHYCHGLKSIVRAERSTNIQDKKFDLRQAVGEFKYVLTHTKSSPEYYLYLAMARLHLGRTYVYMQKISDAITEFTEASRLQPGYALAYFELINVYIKNGTRDEALKVARQGLTRIPDSKVLQKYYRELGGKLPYPTPIENTASDNENSMTPTLTPAATTGPGNNNPTPDYPAKPSQTDTRNQAQEPHHQESPIGSPTNPWCRFCPPSDVETPKKPAPAP